MSRVRLLQSDYSLSQYSFIISQSISPSSRSTSSTSSITTLRNMYGSLADEFDGSTIDALDFDILSDPTHAFADVCYAEALAEPTAHLPSVRFSRASSPDSTLSSSPVGKRRSMWVHNGLGSLDESSSSGDDEEDEDCHSPLDKIAPWAAQDSSLRVQTRPESIIQFVCDFCYFRLIKKLM
jgi:hypothetical protein